MAISKERLEELIKQGATIWHDDYGEINLDKKFCDICEVKSLQDAHIGWVLFFEYEYENVRHSADVEIEALEEDVETAKWHYEMDCSRIERLDLPTWEEFYNGFDDVEFYGKDKKHYLISADYGEEDINLIEKFPLTKDGYLSACRLAKKLFLGENLDEGRE